MLAIALCALALGQAHAQSSAAEARAQALAVSRLEHYADNRGWNEAGLGPTHQVVVVATATPSGVLAADERYVFQVMLEDLEAGVIENRSLSFSDPYTPSR